MNVKKVFLSVLFIFCLHNYCEAQRLYWALDSISSKYAIVDEMGKSVLPYDYDKPNSDTVSIYRKLDKKITNYDNKSCVLTVSKNGEIRFIDLLGYVNNKDLQKAAKQVRKNAKKGIYDKIYAQISYAHLEKQMEYKRKHRLIPFANDGKWGFKEFGDNKEVFAPQYTSVYHIGGFFFVSTDSIEYRRIEEVEYNTAIDPVRYTVTKINNNFIVAHDKTSMLVDSMGITLTGRTYDNLVYIDSLAYKGDYFYAFKNNRCGIISDKCVIHQCIYDYIEDFHYSKAKAYYKGHQVELDTNGSITPNLMKVLFDKVYTSTDNANSIIQMYSTLVEYDQDFNMGFTSSCYNNIGVQYEDNLNDRPTALRYYKMSRDLGDETGKKNYKRLKTSLVLDAITVIANGITNVANSLANNNGNVNNTITPQNNEYKSKNNYQMQYNLYEKQAKSAFSTLTAQGVRVDNGNGHGGVSTLKTNPALYVQNKTYLHNAQRNMAMIRAKAKANGVIIQPSSWEAASVNY